jgi:hypothetical protein
MPPPWSEAPPWAKYVAFHAIDGEWYWYKRIGKSKGCISVKEWRDTLKKRPENE